MGQKTNPTIFQLGKTKKWQYSFHEKKLAEFSKYSENHIELQQFINKYFKNYGLKICDYNSTYTDNQLTIFVSYFITQTTFERTTVEDKKLKKATNTRQLYSKKKVFFFMKKITQKYKRNVLLNRVTTIKKFASTAIINNKQQKQTLKVLKKLSYKSNLFKKFIVRQKEKKKYFFEQKYKNFSYRQNYWKNKKKFGTNYKKNHKIIDQKRKKNSTKYTRLVNIKTLKNMSLKVKTFNDILEESFLNKMLETVSFLNKSTSTIVLNFKQINKEFFKNFTKSQFETLKRILGQLRRFNNETFTNEGLYAIILFLRSQHSINFFSEYLAAEMQKHKRQQYFLNFIKKALVLLNKSNLYNLTDIVIKVKGRFNGAPRSKTRVIKIGKDLSIISVKSKIHYSEKVSFSPNGTFGVKVWAADTENTDATRTKKHKIQKKKERQVT
jgi:hypothetical protein